ncbi:MAG: Gfo/Idh/MocA family oxidoreductase [Coriobacteriia bacterium]|nr:Gfo/Idh/MocA family oxidoreductase [Coriobacteriia bacterium]
MTKLKGAVIGSGNMGRHHVRIMSQCEDVELAYVVDTNITTARELCAQWGGEALPSINEIAYADVAIVAVPTQLHEEVALALINRKVNLLIEKPLADSPAAAQRIVDAAKKAGVVLAVGHVERFNPAIQELKRRLKKPQMISIERLSPYPSRIKDSVVYDLTVHDADLACWLTGSEPTEVHAVGAKVLSDKIDIASTQIKFANGCIATLQTSRITQDKVRRILVSETERFFKVDMLKQDVEIKRSARVENKTEDGRTSYTQETISEIPGIASGGEPLRKEQEDFYHAVRNGSDPTVTGADGLRAVELVDQIEKLTAA